MLETLRAILNVAVRKGYLEVSPFRRVELPKVRAVISMGRELADIKAVLRALQDTELEHPLVVAVGTGLRRGEILGMRWLDLDLDARILDRGQLRQIASLWSSGRP